LLLSDIIAIKIIMVITKFELT